MYDDSGCHYCCLIGNLSLSKKEMEIEIETTTGTRGTLTQNDMHNFVPSCILQIRYLNSIAEKNN